MARSLLKNYFLLLITCGLMKVTHAVDTSNKSSAEDSTVINTCGNTRFYKGLSDDEKNTLTHLIEYHRNMVLLTAVRAIDVYEKMLVSVGSDKNRSDVAERLSYLSNLIHEHIQDAMGTRHLHGNGVFVPMLTCCTPRDAYFRQVVTDLLIVTGDASIAGDLDVAGDLTIGGNLIVTGTVTQDNLIVTGTITTGNLIVLGDAIINGDETVGGDESVLGDVFIGGTLTVTGSSTLSSLTVTGGSNLGSTTISTLDVVCNQTVGCNLTVSGTTTTGALSVLSNATIAGNELIGGTLTVTGSSTFNNAIGITSTSSSTAAAIDESGGTGIGLTITGNASQPAVAIAQGAGQNAILAGVGAVGSPSYSFSGSASTGLYASAANQFALAAGGVNKVNYNGSSVLVSSIYRAAQGATGQVVTAGTTATVTFNNATPLPSPDFSGSVYTAPVSGVYLLAVTFTTTVSAVPGLGNVFIRQNGAIQCSFSLVSVNSGVQNVASGAGVYLLSLTAGQTVDVQLQAVGADFTILGGAPAASTFAIHLVSVP